jgi:acyl-coenzyme A synthetase/AMP-(fatty) acid ligase
MDALIDLSPAAPCPQNFNLAAYVLHAAHETPPKIALTVYSSAIARRYSYAQLARAVFGAATGLRQAGIAAGDRVMLRIGNTVDFPVCFLALAALDAVAMPCSIALTDREVQSLRDKTQPKAMIYDPKHGLAGFDGLTLQTQQVQSFQNLPPAQPILGDPNRPGYIIFTSGTSGQPRAVLHAHRAVWARRMMWAGWYDLGPQDVMMHAGALNWTYTLGTGLMDPWAIGASAVIPNTQEPADLWRIMRAEEASIFAAAPGIYRRLLQQPFKCPPALRHGLSAGDVLPHSVRDSWQERTQTPICEAFGMTECSTFLSATPSAPEQLAVQPGRKIAIFDGEDLAEVGQIGTIAVDGGDPGLMLGYLEDETIQLPLKNGWYHTSDQGQIYADGRIGFAGRSGDMLNAGGYRVAPREIEQVLEACSGVQEVGVTEVEVRPDVFVIAAFVVVEDPCDLAQIDALAARDLARYKQPRIVQKVPALPRNANGKLIRAALPQLWNSAL